MALQRGRRLWRGEPDVLDESRVVPGEAVQHRVRRFVGDACGAVGADGARARGRRRKATSLFHTENTHHTQTHKHKCVKSRAVFLSLASRGGRAGEIVGRTSRSQPLWTHGLRLGRQRRRDRRLEPRSGDTILHSLLRRSDPPRAANREPPARRLPARRPRCKAACPADYHQSWDRGSRAGLIWGAWCDRLRGRINRGDRIAVAGAEIDQTDGGPLVTVPASGCPSRRAGERGGRHHQRARALRRQRTWHTVCTACRHQHPGCQRSEWWWRRGWTRCSSTWHWRRGCCCRCGRGRWRRRSSWSSRG